MSTIFLVAPTGHTSLPPPPPSFYNDIFLFQKLSNDKCLKGQQKACYLFLIKSRLNSHSTLPKKILVKKFHNVKDMMILHVGVHSIIKNFDELREIITFAKTSPNVICTQETRLKYNIPFHYALQNYNFIHVNSLTNAGGVEMFIKSTILFYRAHFLRLFVTVKRFGFKSCYLIVIRQ